jgi:hypothetical protein
MGPCVQRTGGVRGAWALDDDRAAIAADANIRASLRAVFLWLC